MVLIISNPVNSTVPIFAEVLKGAGVFDEKKWVKSLNPLISGCSVLLRLMLSELPDSSPRSRRSTLRRFRLLLSEDTPVLLSFLSSAKLPRVRVSRAKSTRLLWRGSNLVVMVSIHAVPCWYVEVVQAKAGTGSATLSMGFGE
jgi:malate dehydrogenase